MFETLHGRGARLRGMVELWSVRREFFQGWGLGLFEVVGRPLKTLCFRFKIIVKLLILINN
jgi:hypothetical protein